MCGLGEVGFSSVSFSSFSKLKEKAGKGVNRIVDCFEDCDGEWDSAKTVLDACVSLLGGEETAEKDDEAAEEEDEGGVEESEAAAPESAP